MWIQIERPIVLRTLMDRITGTIYQVVINNPNDDDRALCKKVPPYVKTFAFQDEVGSEGTLHINGAIKCRYTVSIAKIKKWLPRAHITVAKSKKHAENILSYAHKDDTHIEGTRDVVNNNVSYRADEICIMLAREVIGSTATDIMNLYKEAVCKILIKERKYAGQLMNPSLRKFWVETYKVWALYALEKENNIVEPIITNADEKEDNTSPSSSSHNEG